jgi:hypothetical protein
MILAALILITSAALLVFYLQTLCERIVRREFKHPYYKLIANTNGLEFPAVRAALEGNGQGVRYERLRLALGCDYRALTYLLHKVEAPATSRSSFEEHLLSLYCHLLFFAMTLRHFLRLQVKPSALKLAITLEYFANVVGHRIEVARASDLTISV